MDGSELEVKKLRVSDGTQGRFLHITLPDGREVLPIRVDTGFVKDFACAVIRATPTEKI